MLVVPFLTIVNPLKVHIGQVTITGVVFPITTSAAVLAIYIIIKNDLPHFGPVWSIVS